MLELFLKQYFEFFKWGSHKPPLLQETQSVLKVLDSSVYQVINKNVY